MPDVFLVEEVNVVSGKWYPIINSGENIIFYANLKQFRLTWNWQ